MNSRRRVMITTLLLYGAFVAVYLLQLAHITDSWLTNSLFMLAPVLAVISGIYATSVYRLTSMTGQVMALMTAGMACWLIGETLFLAYQYVFHTSPFPSVADVFYVAAYPLLFIGLVRYVAAQRINWKGFNPLVVVLSGLLAVALLFIVGYFDIYLAYNAGNPALNNMVAMGYGIGDLLLIIPLFFILKIAMDLRGGKLFYSWTTILFAALFMMVGDILYAIYSNQYNAMSSGFFMIDLFWIAGYLLFAYGFFFAGHTVKEIQASIKSKARSKV